YENGVPARPIVHNLPDFGNYMWLVPEMWSTNSSVHATFRDVSGVDRGEADTGSFKVVYTTVPGTLVNRYRLDSPVTLEHLYTTDFYEYTVLGQNINWVQEGVASLLHNGPANIGGVEATPYYRVYDFINRWHFWTTDRNEYFTLRQYTGRYSAEGVDGYIFPSQVAGTVPWFRLAYSGIPGLHHWTLDQNERNVLLTRGWVEEDHKY